MYSRLRCREWRCPVPARWRVVLLPILAGWRDFRSRLVALSIQDQKRILELPTTYKQNHCLCYAFLLLKVNFPRKLFSTQQYQTSSSSKMPAPPVGPLPDRASGRARWPAQSAKTRQTDLSTNRTCFLHRFQ